MPVDPLIEFRAQDWANVDGIYLEITRGFLARPQVRGDDYVIAALPGRSSGNRVSDVLDILAEGYVAGVTSEDWRANTDLLMAVLDENGVVPGTLIVRAPLYGLGAGEEASITARVVNAIPGPVGAGYASQTWSIQLQSLDTGWVLSTPGS
jgi:hypothetical protein